MKNLKIVYSKYIPFKGYKAITLFNGIVIREEYKEQVGYSTLNHEKIHQAQAYDFGIGFCGYFIFYLGYLIEWLLKLPGRLFGYNPYYSISFEQEAYRGTYNPTYLDERKRFSGMKYIFKILK